MAGSPYPEIDRVLFNGHPIGSLSGADGQWKLNEFEVPIAWVKFARRATGSTPQAAQTLGQNILEINIDTVSPSSQENW
jgi:hypothetical protein